MFSKFIEQYYLLNILAQSNNHDYYSYDIISPYVINKLYQAIDYKDLNKNNDDRGVLFALLKTLNLLPIINKYFRVEYFPFKYFSFIIGNDDFTEVDNNIRYFKPNMDKYRLSEISKLEPKNNKIDYNTLTNILNEKIEIIDEKKINSILNRKEKNKLKKILIVYFIDTELPKC